MKKQIKRLSLSKKTISNLNLAEMDEKLGGQWTVRCYGNSYHGNCGGGGGGNSTHCPTAYGKNTCAPNC